MLTVRRAAIADAGRVRRLIEALEAPQAFPEGPFLRTYERNLANPDIVYLVAGEGDAVVAFGSLLFMRPLHHGAPVAEITELVVDGSHRGAGVGARIIGEMKKLAMERGCCVLELASNRVRTDAHRFYERNGFTPSHVKFTMRLAGTCSQGDNST